MASKDLYEILGVAKSAGSDEIKKAYRRLAKQHHPDMNPGNKKAEEKFKTINAAFEVLSSPEKRKLYDEFGEDAMRIGFDQEKARAYRQWRSQPGGSGRTAFDFGDIFGQQSPGAGFDLGDLFGDLFRGGPGARYETRGPSRQRGPMARGGADVEATLVIPLSEALHGGDREIGVERDGHVQHLRVKVPPGIDDGQVIRLAGQGQPGALGGPPGDLLLTVQLEPHPFLRREGADLHGDVPVTVAEAMFGGRIEIPTPNGNVKLTIPAGSQSGDTLRLKGKGAPEARGRPAGDFYVQLVVHVPIAPDSDPARQAAEALEALYERGLRERLKI